MCRKCLEKHSHYDIARVKEIFHEKEGVWILRCKKVPSNLLNNDSKWITLSYLLREQDVIGEQGGKFSQNS